MHMQGIFDDILLDQCIKLRDLHTHKRTEPQLGGHNAVKENK